jgi:hypothetical protein
MINLKKEYIGIVERIEKLFSIPENIGNTESQGYVKPNLLSDLVQEKHHPIPPPTLSEAKKLRMLQRGLSLE